MKVPSNFSRCISIVGPSQSGKTSLMESILHICKQIPNKGKVGDNNTLSDYLPEEHDLKMSISLGISNVQFMDEDILFLIGQDQVNLLMNFYKQLNIRMNFWLDILVITMSLNL